MRTFAEFYVIVALAMSGLVAMSAWVGYWIGNRGEKANLAEALNTQADNHAKALKTINDLKALGAFDQGAEVMRADLVRIALDKKSEVRHYDDLVELIASHKIAKVRAWEESKETTANIA